MDIVLLGAPGAGKGTQAKALAAELGLLHISTGELFREAARLGTPLGQQAQAYMLRGELVPDDLTIALLREQLGQPAAARGVLLDGFPRTLAQAEALDALLAAHGRRVDRAVFLDVPRDVLLARLSGRWFCSGCETSYHSLFRPPTQPGICDRCGQPLYQRPDDRPETAARRLDVYLERTAPLLDYYQRAGVLVRINGDQPVEAVHRALLEALTSGRS